MNLLPSSQSIRSMASGGVLLAATSVACGAAAAPLPSDPQAQLAGQVCQAVLQTEPGEERNDACVESLTESMKRAGLQPSEASPTASLRTLTIPGDGRPYTTASLDQLQARYRLACRLVGFGEDNGPLRECAAGLSLRMFALDNPLT